MRRKGSDLLIDLAGKDFFTAEEAAVYCGISLDRWRKVVEPHIRPGQFMGQTIFRREDVKRYIEDETKWQSGLPWEPNWAALNERPASGKAAKNGAAARRKGKL